MLNCCVCKKPFGAMTVCDDCGYQFCFEHGAKHSCDMCVQYAADFTALVKEEAQQKAA